MKHRLAFVAMISSISVITMVAAMAAETETNVERAKIDKAKVVPSLLVMSARAYSYDDGKLTLHGVSPLTVSFSDRPARLAGSVPTESIVADWAEGRDSFEKVPPNADFSTFDEKGTTNAVVELKNPVLSGNDLTYDVRVLKGQLPANGQASSLFIDIIGMPFTPMSFAGVARRTARRSAYWGMAAPVYARPGVVAPHAVIY